MIDALGCFRYHKALLQPDFCLSSSWKSTISTWLWKMTTASPSIMLDTVQNGYPGLARLIGPNIDQGLGIFREFAELNAKNLLYMQAEIICLQKELDVETYKDEYGPDAIANSFSRSVQDMRQSTTSKDRGQWKKVLEIRDRLSAYSTFLIHPVKSFLLTLTTIRCLPYSAGTNRED